MGRTPPTLAALVCVACGSRTGLLDGAERATPDASGTHVGDAGPRDGPADALLERALEDDGVPDVEPVRCTSDTQCNDGIACTIDRCDLAEGACSHDPDNALCPPGFACSPPCVAASFAESPSAVYGVDLPAGSVATVGSTGSVRLDDIALDAHGTLYGVDDSGTLYTVDTKTGTPTVVASTGRSFNALDFAPDGTLYGALEGGDEVFTIDPVTGHTKHVATYPDGYVSSGDLAVIGNKLLATVNQGDGENDVLVSVDLATFDVTVIGSTGYPQIYGLAAYGKQLFGYTGNGRVLQIDPATAKSKVLASTGIVFYGASAR